jgi:hypothetical protein
MEEIKTLIHYLNARIEQARHDEHGFSAIEWLVIVLGVVTIAGAAVIAVKSYVIGQTNKLGTP